MIAPNFRQKLSIVIDSKSSALYYWLVLVCIGCFYNLFMVFAFVFKEIYTCCFLYWLLSNIFFDAIFLIDIVLQSRINHSYYDETSKDSRQMTGHYFSSYSFWLDLASVMPTDLLLLIRSDLSLIRINRLLKCYRFKWLIDRTEMRTNWPNAFRILILISTCLVLFHCNACAYFLISLASGIGSDDRGAWQFTYSKIADVVFPECGRYQVPDCAFDEADRNRSNRDTYIEQMTAYWNGKTKVLKFPNFVKEYALSIYWSSLTLTTKGQQPYPLTSIEDGLEIVDTLIGLLIFAVIVGSVGNVVSTMNKNQSEFQESLDGIKFYMTYRQVDDDLQTRVMNCCDYIHDQSLSQDEMVLLDGLPQRLRYALAAHVHLATLQRVELLKRCEPGLLLELVLRLKFQVFSPNDYLCRRGELAKEMFIVKRGELHCVGDNEAIVLAVLRNGAVFGELSLLNLPGKINGNKHVISVRSVGYTDVYILRQEDVDIALRDYPEARHMLNKKAIEMLRDEQMWNEDVSEAPIEHKAATIDEQCQGIDNALNKIDREITQLYESFDQLTANLKQRMARLEGIYKYKFGTNDNQLRLKWRDQS